MPRGEFSDNRSTWEASVEVFTNALQPSARELESFRRIATAVWLIGGVVALVMIAALGSRPPDGSITRLILMSGFCLSAASAAWLSPQRLLAHTELTTRLFLIIAVYCGLRYGLSGNDRILFASALLTVQSAPPFIFTRRQLGIVLGTSAVCAAGVALSVPAPVDMRISWFVVFSAVSGVIVVATWAIAVDRRRLERSLEDAAYRDGLTQIRNRRGFFGLGTPLMANNTELWMIAFDLNDFKLINDEFGHAVGDEVLIEVAEVLQAHENTSTVVGRLGGEEFGILLAGATNADVDALVERISDGLATLSTHPVSASFGVSRRQSSDEELVALYRRADVTLYEEKRRVHAERVRVADETGTDHSRRVGPPRSD